MLQEKVLNIAQENLPPCGKSWMPPQFSSWRLTRPVSHDMESVLLTADDDESGFLSTVQKAGIAV